MQVNDCPKKYVFTDEEKKIEDDEKTYTLHRIQAMRDFGDVKKGDQDGWIQGEWNLEDYGTCWVYDEAMVFGKHAEVRQDAKVRGNARVISGCDWHNIVTFVSGNAVVEGNAVIRGSLASGSAVVSGEAKVTGSAVGEKATVKDHAEVKLACDIVENAVIQDYATVTNHSQIGKDAVIGGHVFLDGVELYDCNISGKAYIGHIV